MSYSYCERKGCLVVGTFSDDGGKTYRCKDHWIEHQAATLEALRGCVKMLLKSAVPNAKDHPMMWDAWGDAAVLLGLPRDARRIPHADLKDGARALTAIREGKTL